jgi:4-hydroxybenzoate polyprenyltransferase
VIREIKLFLLLCRPAVLLLLALFAAIGAARGGVVNDLTRMAEIAAIIASFLVFSVAANDLADAAIDRINLPGDRRRPLVTGTARQTDMVLLLACSAVLTLGVAAVLNVAVLITACCGLLLSAAYSLPPSRLANRGAVASMILPACYVATPFLIGLFAGRSAPRPADLVLLAGLYVGFIGRIMLKDFRDVRGDALFGKRTFLVRHGRRATCRLSAALWTVGTILIVSTGRRTDASTLTYAVPALGVLVLLALLAKSQRPHRDELIIASIAILGRGLLLTLLARDQLAGGHWSGAVQLTLAVITAGQAWSMYRHGPRTRQLVVDLEIGEDRDRPSHIAVLS